MNRIPKVPEKMNDLRNNFLLGLGV